jgi:hypothetical protein
VAYGGWWSADPAQKNNFLFFLTHSMTTPNQLAKGIGLGLYEGD